MYTETSVREARQKVFKAGLLDPDHEWMACDWQALCGQMLKQWNRLTLNDLKGAGPSRRRLAELVHRKYGVAPEAVENYLFSIERILPLMQRA